MLSSKHKLNIRVTSMSMLIVMLFSSVGLSLKCHFCENELQSVGLFTKANLCGEQCSTIEDCCIGNNCKESELRTTGCCNDKGFIGKLNFNRLKHIPISQKSMLVFNVRPLGLTQDMRCFEEIQSFLRQPISLQQEDILLYNQVFLI